MDLALIGSIAPDSRPVYATGMLSFSRFLLSRGKVDTIPPEDPGDLPRWLFSFSRQSTGASYLSHVVKACHLAKVSTEWFPPAVRDLLKRARRSRTGDAESLAPPVYRLDITERMFQWGRSHWPAFAFLAAFAYAFGLRVPSEALPARKETLSIRQDSREVVWTFFQGRKHKPLRHSSVRACVCPSSSRRVLCPYHLALEWLAQIPAGGFLFPGDQMCSSPISSSKVSNVLKSLGENWGYCNWRRWASHGWRRGVASETALTALRAPGTPASRLQTILEADDWSPTGRSYLLYISSIFGEAVAIGASSSLIAESDGEDE